MHPQEENFYKAVGIAAIVLGFIIAYFIVNMIRHQRRNARLYKAKIKAEITAQENERKRIAHDMHDELGPVISAVKLQINHLELNSDNDRQIIERSNKYIDDIVKKMREIAYNLLPNTLVRHGLVKALEEYVHKTYGMYDLEIQLEHEGEWQLSKEEEINIYRIVQEIIHNTIKHAKARKLKIQLRRDQDKLYLITTDNGIGFDYDRQSTKNVGLGLFNLQSRAEILNAKFSLKSEAGKGTRFIFEIPVK